MADPGGNPVPLEPINREAADGCIEQRADWRIHCIGICTEDGRTGSPESETA